MPEHLHLQVVRMLRIVMLRIKLPLLFVAKNQIRLPAARTKQTGRVDKDDLCRAFHGDTAKAGARGLHFMRHDRNLRSDHPVQKRRLPGVRLSDEGHEPGAGVGCVVCHATASS